MMCASRPEELDKANVLELVPLGVAGVLLEGKVAVSVLFFRNQLMHVLGGKSVVSEKPIGKSTN
jgi:hypothetical protein